MQRAAAKMAGDAATAVLKRARRHAAAMSGAAGASRVKIAANLRMLLSVQLGPVSRDRLPNRRAPNALPPLPCSRARCGSSREISRWSSGR